MTDFALFHRPRHMPRWLSSALLALGILCILFGAWIVASRAAYKEGAIDMYPAAWQAGYAAGRAVSAQDAFKSCAPWGAWKDRKVVICQVPK